MTAGLHHHGAGGPPIWPSVAPGDRALDVATGTGDLALELARRVAPGGDGGRRRLLERMLELARAKAAAAPRRRPGVESASRPPTRSRSLWRRRVRRRHGRVRRAQLLRSSRAASARWPAWSAPAAGSWCSRSPRHPPPLSTFLELWFDRVVPVLGRLAGDADAYSYLPISVRRFPAPEELAARHVGLGLRDVRYVLTAGGIIAMHVGEVPRHERGPGPCGRSSRPAASPAARLMERARERGWPSSPAAMARCWPATPATRSPPAASACGRCCCSWPPGRPLPESEALMRAGGGRRAGPLGHAGPRRRARRLAAAPRPAHRDGRRRAPGGDGDGRPAVLTRVRGARAAPGRSPRCRCCRAPARSWPRGSSCSAPTPGEPWPPSATWSAVG